MVSSTPVCDKNTHTEIDNDNSGQDEQRSPITEAKHRAEDSGAI